MRVKNPTLRVLTAAILAVMVASPVWAARGSADFSKYMAIGDSFGSNLFNLVILAVDDVFFRQADLLASISPVHMFSALSALAMTGVAIVGLYFRSSVLLLNRFGWPSMVLRGSDAKLTV